MKKENKRKLHLILRKIEKENLEVLAQWYLWLKNNKSLQDREEIIIGSILTQNSSWKNVEKAIDNLRRERFLQLNKIARCSLSDFENLKKLIKPAGFFNQKAQYLKNISIFFKQNGGVSKFLQRTDILFLRKELLAIKGVGRETADTILNYALDKPFFVIDSYTKKFLKKEQIIFSDDYEKLREFFEEVLEKDFLLYQKVHAIIVQKGKNKNND